MQTRSLTMADIYIIKDIRHSFAWLDHGEHGYTELSAFHNDYRPGKGNYKHNIANKSFPKTIYTKKPDMAVAFVKRYSIDHTCCFSINSRPQIFRTKNGYARRALESEIELVTNFFFDIDPISDPIDEQIAELELLLVRADEYFSDLGVLQPVKAFSGRGYHLLFPVPPIKVSDTPDIKQRLNQFRLGFYHEFIKQFSDLELRLDNTMDLCRVAKIYGTKKPFGKRISRFYGGERIVDNKLKNHLLSMSIETNDDRPALIPETLPEKFKELLDIDHEIRQLWEGTGKIDGDTSNSGYDFSLIKMCLRSGITDLKDLSSILALRPRGAVQLSGKGTKYIKYTISNAIK